MATTWTMPTNQAEVKKIKEAIDATYQSYETINNEKAQLTDIFNDIHATTGIPRRIFNTMARWNYYGNAQDAKTRASEISEAWDALENVQ